MKFKPHIPKPKARKISVNEIGKPIKITKIMAPSMINPIIGLGISKKPPRSNKEVTHSKIGRILGT